MFVDNCWIVHLTEPEKAILVDGGMKAVYGLLEELEDRKRLHDFGVPGLIHIERPHAEITSATLLGDATRSRISDETMKEIFSRNPDMVDSFLLDPVIIDGVSLLTTNKNWRGLTRENMITHLKKAAEKTLKDIFEIDKPYQEYVKYEQTIEEQEIHYLADEIKLKYNL